MYFLFFYVSFGAFIGFISSGDVNFCFYYFSATFLSFFSVIFYLFVFFGSSTASWPSGRTKSSHDFFIPSITTFLYSLNFSVIGSSVFPFYFFLDFGFYSVFSVLAKSTLILETPKYVLSYFFLAYFPLLPSLNPINPNLLLSFVSECLATLQSVISPKDSKCSLSSFSVTNLGKFLTMILLINNIKSNNIMSNEKDYESILFDNLSKLFLFFRCRTSILYLFLMKFVVFALLTFTI